MTTIRKADGLAFQANMEYILNIIGTKANDEEYEVETRGGLLSSVYVRPWQKEDKLYTVFSCFNKIPPEGTIPKWLYNPRNGICNWHIAECDDYVWRGWIRPYEEIMKGLCLMIHGHDNFPNAIAKRGRLEDFIPERGHLVYGKEKLTVAAFRKKYVTALGIEGCLMMDGLFLADNVPFSPFGKDALICIFPQ